MTRTVFAPNLSEAALKERRLEDRMSRNMCNKTERMRFSLIGPASVCTKDLHQYLPIFTSKKQLATQERGASNSKDTAQDACPLGRSEVDSACADGGKIGERLHRRFEWPRVVKKSSAVQKRKSFPPSSLIEKSNAWFLVIALRHAREAPARVQHSAFHPLLTICRVWYDATQCTPLHGEQFETPVEMTSTKLKLLLPFFLFRKLE
jgi:hypothetical protein